MKKNKDGGSAFPDGTTNEWGYADRGGMSLRDYFAAKAMQALIGTVGQNASRAEEAVCGVAYLYADQMLKQREIYIDYSKKEEVKEDEHRSRNRPTRTIPCRL